MSGPTSTLIIFVVALVLGYSVDEGILLQQSSNLWIWSHLRPCWFGIQHLAIVAGEFTIFKETKREKVLVR
jgi:hypothetical protein